MSSSDALKWLNENFNFVDSVTIIDHSGTIIAKQRFTPATPTRRTPPTTSGHWAKEPAGGIPRPELSIQCASGPR